MDQTTSVPVSAPAAAEAQAVRYGGFWRRAAARFIDGIIVAIGIVIINLVLAALVGGKNPIVTIIDVLLGWGYFCYMTKEFGATYGKKAVGVEVRMESGEPLTWGAVILRETIGKIASSIILCIGYIMVAFTPKKRGLHDYIGSTVVVHKDPANVAAGLVWTINIIQTLIVAAAIVAGFIFARLFVEMSKLPASGQTGSVQFQLSNQEMQQLLQQYQNQAASNTPAK